MSAAGFVVLAALIGSAPLGETKGTRIVLLASPAPAPEAGAVAAFVASLASQPGVSVVVVPSQTPALEEQLGREIDEALVGVQEAYRRLDLTEATRLLQALENARLSELGCHERMGHAARLSFWLGVVYAAKKDVAKANDRFAMALSIDPTYVIDTRYFPPATVAVFEDVRRRLSSIPTGGMSLSTEPEEASVYLDGKLINRAPVTLTATEGDHLVCVRRPGWHDWAARLHLTAGHVDTQRVYLQRGTPQEVAAALKVTLDAPVLRLASPAHVAALGEAFSADLVAVLDGPGQVTWRVVATPSEPHQIEHQAPWSVEALASEFLSQITPTSSVSPSRRRLELQLTASGGLAFGLSSASIVGGRLGLWWNVVPSMGVGVGAGFNKGFGTLNFVHADAATVALATAAENLEVPLSAGARWAPVQTSGFRLTVALNATFRALSWSTPSIVLPPPASVPFTVIIPQPFSTVASSTLGPHAGLQAHVTLGPGVALVFGLDYGFEWALTPPGLSVDLLSRTGAGVSKGALTSETTRQVASLEVGVEVGLG